MWEKINKIFPEGGIDIGGEYLTNDAIKNSHLDSIVTNIFKPVRSMLEYQIEYTYYSNGNMIAKTVYNVFPPDMIDGIPLLNVYGQKILNDIK